MEGQHATEEQLVHHQQDWTDASALAHLPLAQPLEQPSSQMQFPNLMPAITTLIMQITSNLSHGNPQLALFFQPLVNMALNMQLQAWQQASATAAAHSLPMALMEQMHAGLAMAPQQTSGGLTLDATTAAAVAQHAAAAAASEQQVGVDAQQPPQQAQQAQQQQPEADALPPPVSALASAATQEQQQAAQQAAQQVPGAEAALAVASAAVAAAAAQQPQQRAAVGPGLTNGAAAGSDAAAGIAQTYRETYGSEGSEGEEAEDDHDDDYTAKGERSGRRGARAGGAHRPKRARKRNKLLDEYLTDDEEGEGGGHTKQRRAHLE